MLQEKTQFLFPASGYRSGWMTIPVWTVILTIACAISCGWRALFLPLAIPLMAATLGLYIPRRKRLVFWGTLLFGLLPVIRPQLIATPPDAIRLLLGAASFLTLTRAVLQPRRRALSIALTIVLSGLLTIMMAPMLSWPTEPHAFGFSLVKFLDQLPYKHIFHAHHPFIDAEIYYYLPPQVKPSIIGIFSIRYADINKLLIIGWITLLWQFYNGCRIFYQLIPISLFTILYGTLTLLGRHHIEYMLPVITPIIPLLVIIAAQCVAPFRIKKVNFANFAFEYRRMPNNIQPTGIPKFLYLLLIIFLAAIYIATLYPTISTGSILGWDSASYEEAWEHFRNGIPDAVRTPLYPLFIGLCKICFNENYLYAISIIQILATLGSVFLFRRLARRFINNEWLIFWGCVVVFMNPDLIHAAGIEMSETLSMVSVLLYTDALVRSIQTVRMKDISESMIWSIVLLALKPGFLWVLPLESVLWIIVAWKRKSLRLCLRFSIAALIPVGLLYFYSKPIKSYYNVKSFSYIGTVNFLYDFAAMGVVDASACPDSVLRGHLEKIYGDSLNPKPNPLDYIIWDYFHHDMLQSPLQDRYKPLDNFIHSTMDEHLWELPGFVLQRFSLITPNGQLIHSSGIFGTTLIQWGRPFMSMVNTLLLIFFTVTIWQITRQTTSRGHPDMICGIIIFCIPWLMYLSNYIVSVISGFTQWYRLNLYVWPLLVIVGLQLLQMLKPAAKATGRRQTESDRT